MNKQKPDPNCDLCDGEGVISQSGYDDSDSNVHFGSVDCDCTKEIMNNTDKVILERLKRLEEDPDSAIPWNKIKRN